MPSIPHNLLSYLRDVVGAWRDDPREDAELLGRFADTGEEAAFKALVWRHGPLVWRTCARVLGDGPDAEDTFQAVFLVLARKASRLRREPLAGWLHHVARQAALKANAGIRQRRVLEQRLRDVMKPKMKGKDESYSDLYTALDEELVGLPERLRVPLLLHYLEGKTQVEVARILGCGRSVLQRRLARGEAILRKRLEKRGLAIDVGTLTDLLTSSIAASALPARLIGSTARAAAAFRSGTLTGGATEAARAVLGALPSTFTLETAIMRKSLWIVLACSLALGGSALVASRALRVWPNELSAADPATALSVKQSGPIQGEEARVDCYGDPLPVGALARLGTVRLRVRIPGGVCSAAFSPDGKTLVTGGELDGTVHLWEVASGKEIQTLRGGHRGSVCFVAFSPDGKTVATRSEEDSTVRLWEVASGEEIRTMRGHGVTVQPGVFSSDWKIVASGGSRGEVRLWEVATGKEIRTMRGHGRGKVVSVAVSSDSKTVASGGQDGTVRLWEVATGKEIRTLKGHQKWVWSVAFSSDGKTLASGGEDGTVRLWEADTGKEIRTLKGHQERVKSVTFSPDGKTVASGGYDGTVRLWEAATGKEIQTLDGYQVGVSSVVFSPNGKLVASGGMSDPKVRLWEVATGKEIRALQGHQAPAQSVAFSPNGKTLITGGWDETVRLWNVATGKEIRTLRGHQKWVWSVAFSSDGKTVASGGDDGTVRLWEADTGKEIRTLKGHQGRVMSVALSSDGKIVASGGGDGTVRLWEAATGKEIHILPALEKGKMVKSVAFSPDGKTVVSGGEDHTVRLWETATGKEIHTLRGHQEQIWSVAFSSDSKIVASGSFDSTVRLWEVATGKEIQTLKVQEGVVKNVAFSSDGKTVALGGEYKTVHVWDMATGKEIRTLRGHQGRVHSVAFSPDGRTLASVSWDTTGLIWDVAPLAQRKPMQGCFLPSPAPLAEEPQVEAAWTELGNIDPAKAYPALWQLTRSPAQALTLLRARLRPAAPVADLQQLKRWIADLDDDDFKVRDKAQRAIEKLGEPAFPALRQALQGQAGLEAKRRLQDLLASGEPLRELRGVQVLEYIGTAEARWVLQTLAQGASGARLTEEAQAALVRLAKRPPS